MHWSRKDMFLEEILAYVKFPFDRRDIKSELEGHILDKMDYYIQNGYDEEKAEELSISDMGNSKEIGEELNRQHNPLLGWLWKITNVIVVLSIFCSVLFIGLPFISSLFNGSTVNNIPNSNIIYKINIDRKVKLDDTTIHFTKVIYEKNGDMSIFYEYYDAKLWGTGWSLGTIGNITDNLGTKYFNGSGEGGGGIKAQCIRTVNNFSRKATSLIINYDNYNRKYKVVIPLKVGDRNE